MTYLRAPAPIADFATKMRVGQLETELTHLAAELEALTGAPALLPFGRGFVLVVGQPEAEALLELLRAVEKLR